MNTMYKRIQEFEHSRDDQLGISLLVDYTKEEMQKRLRLKQKLGRRGWWDKGACSNTDLQNKILEHISKGNWIDVANYAAMLHYRENNL